MGLTAAVLLCGIACTQTNPRAELPTTPASGVVGLAQGFQRGVAYAHIHRLGHGYGSARSAATLTRLQGLRVDAVTLQPFGYQRKVTDDAVMGYPGIPGTTDFFKAGVDPSLTDELLAAEIRRARQAGVHVIVKPHVWSTDYWDGKEWHGTIRQLDAAAHARWWKSYRAFALHYARVAQSAGAETYCIGTELVMMTLTHPREWRGLIKELRGVFSGTLTYAAHHHKEAFEIAFWDALDAVGVNAYFPLDAPAGAPVDKLVAAWAPHRGRLDALARRTGKPIVFTEVGYRPVAGNHVKPWDYKGKAYDPGAQAVAFEALFRALAGAPWWRGMYIWNVATDPSRSYESGGASHSFLGLPAEETIRRWYGRQ
jgi:hypothetical protein